MHYKPPGFDLWSLQILESTSLKLCNGTIFFLFTNMVYRPTSFTVGDSPSTLQIIGIIFGVIVGLALAVVVILSLLVCCVLFCCPKKDEPNTASNASRENRSGDPTYFRKLLIKFEGDVMPKFIC